MKQHIITFISLTLAFVALGQSKRQTIEWLNSKFPNQGIGYKTKIGEYRATASIDANGGFKQATRIYGNNSVVIYITMGGNFKSFNASTAKIEKEGDYFFIMLFCSNGAKCVTQEEYRGEFEHVYLGPFKMSEENLDKRLLKAFRRLIVLCGGKGSEKEAY